MFKISLEFNSSITWCLYLTYLNVHFTFWIQMTNHGADPDPVSLSAPIFVCLLPFFYLPSPFHTCPSDHIPQHSGKHTKWQTPCFNTKSTMHFQSTQGHHGDEHWWGGAYRGLVGWAAGSITLIHLHPSPGGWMTPAHWQQPGQVSCTFLGFYNVPKQENTEMVIGCTFCSSNKMVHWCKRTRSLLHCNLWE